MISSHRIIPHLIETEIFPCLYILKAVGLQAVSYSRSYSLRNDMPPKTNWGWWRQSLVKATFALHNHRDVWTIIISGIGLALATTALWYLASRVGLLVFLPQNHRLSCRTALFPRLYISIVMTLRQMPFNHVWEATNAIAPLIKQRYLQERDMSYLGGFWQVFTDCKWIELSETGERDDDTLWY